MEPQYGRCRPLLSSPITSSMRQQIEELYHRPGHRHCMQAHLGPLERKPLAVVLPQELPRPGKELFEVISGKLQAAARQPCPAYDARLHGCSGNTPSKEGCMHAGRQASRQAGSCHLNSSRLSCWLARPVLACSPPIMQDVFKKCVFAASFTDAGCPLLPCSVTCTPANRSAPCMLPSSPYI